MAQARSGVVGEEVTGGKRRGASQSAPATPPICSVGFCPICMVVTAASDARPELMEHLLAVGRELLLAARAVIDARLEGTDGPVRLERLTIE